MKLTRPSKLGRFTNISCDLKTDFMVFKRAFVNASAGRFKKEELLFKLL